MSEQIEMIVDTAERLLSRGVDKALLDAAETGAWSESLLGTIEENGFHELGREGSGTGYAEVYAFLDVAGAQAVPLPLAEMLLTNVWLSSPSNVTSIGVLVGDEVVDVPWARNATRVVGVTRKGEAVVSENFQVLEQGQSVGGEPRDRVRLNARDPVDIPQAWNHLALSRAAMMAGGLRTALQQAITYATEREQFGRPISKFQAIQHTLAVMAAEVAAAGRAVGAAVDAIDSERFEVEVAAAKSRAGEAVGIVCEAAHQVHGAIGFTHEHRLHHTTRRLWAWRDEYGHEGDWQQVLGQSVCGLGANSVWDFVSSST